MTKRGVPVKAQLRSHKLFAKSIEKYISVVDAAKIYSTNAWNGPAEVKATVPSNKCFLWVHSPGLHVVRIRTRSWSVSISVVECS